MKKMKRGFLLSGQLWSVRLAVLLFLVLRTLPGLAATIVDAAGREVTFQEPFSRIISLYPAHTENLFSLGLDREIIGAGPNDDFPARATRLKVFSYRDDAEKIIAARPDLVLIRPMIARGYAKLVAQLRRAGITVVSLQPGSVPEMFAYWRTLGVLTGREDRAATMISRFRRELGVIKDAVAEIPAAQRKRVYFESIHSRMKTFSPGSMAVFVLESSGGVNVAADARPVRGTNIAAYGKERILAHAGEIDVYLAQEGRMNRISLETILKEPGFAAIRAVREGQVFLVDEKIVSRPTMRLLHGIRRIGGILYPEIFDGSAL